MNQSPQEAERHVRVFISSTFRDMQEERDVLMKFVFPKIRKLCEERGVTFTEVDLRWGITEEQAHRGEVLPICLAEIEHCRPYFIGLLGERYGWVPEEVSPDMLAQQPWVSEHRFKSVTELEIIHGVLSNSAMGNRAYFYFRDPAYSEQVTAERRTSFVEQDPVAREKLESLKDRIRSSGVAWNDNYPDPRTLGEWVLEDLSAMINRQFPPQSQPDPLAKEAVIHEAFARSRTGVYIGRQTYFARLDQQVTGSMEPLVVLGESGSGKSAILANWAVRHRQSHPDDFVLLHFVGAAADSSDWVAMLRRIMGELKLRFQLPTEIPAQAEELRASFGEWLRRAGERGRVILIIDALNQLDDRDGALDLVWLPTEMPPRVHLIVSTLAGRPLADLQGRSWPMLTVEPLTADERRQLIREFLCLYTKSLSFSRTERIAAAPQASNPLYLRALLEELRVFGEHDRLDQRIDHYLTAATIDNLYERILERYEQDYESERPGLVSDAMSLIWASRRGVSEAELLDLLGRNGQRLPVAFWSPLHLAAEHQLVSRAGLIDFSHNYLRHAVRDRYVPTIAEQHSAHLRLADYFQQQPRQTRSLEELPWQLSQSESWVRLRDLLADLPFLTMFGESRILELLEYWQRLQQHTHYRAVDTYQSVVQDPDRYSECAPLLIMLFSMMGNLDEDLSLCEAQRRLAERRGDRKLLAETLCRISKTLWLRSEYDRGLKLTEEAERIYRELEDKAGLATCLNQRAQHVRITTQDWAETLRLHREEEQLLRELGACRSLAGCLSNQAVQLRRLGDNASAMRLYIDAERLYRETADLDGIARVLVNRAGATDDHELALKMISEAEHIYRRLGKALGLANVLRSQSDVVHHQCMQDYSPFDRSRRLRLEREALPRAEEALRLFQQMRMPDEVRSMQSRVDNLRELIETSKNLQEMGGANLFEQLHQQSIRQREDNDTELLPGDEQITEEINDDEFFLRDLNEFDNEPIAEDGDGDSFSSLERNGFDEDERSDTDPMSIPQLARHAQHLFDHGDFFEALEAEERIAHVSRQAGDTDALQRALGNQAAIHQALDNLETSMELLREQEQVCRESGNARGLSFALGSQAMLQLQNGNLEGALSLNQQKERLARKLGDSLELAACLTFQGDILSVRGELEQALQLYIEGERLSREAGDQRGAIIALGNRAWLLADNLGRLAEALPLAEEAFRLAISHGLMPIAEQMKLNLEEIRSRQTSD